MKKFYKSKLTHIKDIEKRNKAFHALSDEDKRKEIAWDCLNLVWFGKVGANPCGYWSDNLDSIETTTPKEFQRILNEELPVCQVCARGGMMLSQIRLGNSISGGEFGRAYGIRQIIKGFDIDSFEEMESEFECSTFMMPYIEHTKEKLANICCNVIVNGDFNAHDRTDYLTQFNIKL